MLEAPVVPTMDEPVARNPLVAQAAVDWDIEALVSDYARAHPRVRTPFAVLLGAMLLGTPVKKTIPLLNERPEPTVAAMNTRNATLYAHLMQLLSAQGHPRVTQTERKERRLTRELVIRQLREKSRYWRGGGWKRLMALSRPGESRVLILSGVAHGTRDFAVDPKPVDGVKRIAAGSYLRYEVSVEGFAYGYLLHGNEKGEVTLLSPSWLAPGPLLPNVNHLVVPNPGTSPIVARRPGSVDTVVAILLRYEDPLGLENSGDPIGLSDDDVKDIEWKLRALRNATPNHVEVNSTTYHVVTPHQEDHEA